MRHASPFIIPILPVVLTTSPDDLFLGTLVLALKLTCIVLGANIFRAVRVGESFGLEQLCSRQLTAVGWHSFIDALALLVVRKCLIVCSGVSYVFLFVLLHQAVVKRHELRRRGPVERLNVLVGVVQVLLCRRLIGVRTALLAV